MCVCVCVPMLRTCVYVCVRVPRTCGCVGACVRACVSLTSDSSETVEVFIIKLGMVTASDMVMHQVLIILTLVSFKVTQIIIMKINVRLFIQTVQAIPIKFAVKIVQVKVYIYFSVR